jgi:hypothetical protein
MRRTESELRLRRPIAIKRRENEGYASRLISFANKMKKRDTFEISDPIGFGNEGM